MTTTPLPERPDGRTDFEILDPQGLAEIARRGQAALRQPSIDASARGAAIHAMNHPLVRVSQEVAENLMENWARISPEVREEIVRHAREHITIWELRGRCEAQREVWSRLVLMDDELRHG
ncbi:MAG: hypothetical protein R3310_12530 [Candidatus Competibacteraceae bacterium]|nr:hypothetical protein [Candidatus Competibacteraceae bacterium]